MEAPKDEQLVFTRFLGRLSSSILMPHGSYRRPRVATPLVVMVGLPWQCTKARF